MRRALVMEPTQVLNPLLTAKKMRDLTSTYIRHTIRRPIRPSDNNRNLRDTRIRMNAADYFFVLCRQILP
jgi:hypothetical protein